LPEPEDSYRRLDALLGRMADDKDQKQSHTKDVEIRDGMLSSGMDAGVNEGFDGSTNCSRRDLR
jgi:hypothetical protein